MPKLRHYDNLNTARFVTFSCYHRYPFFFDENAILIFLDNLDKSRIQSKVKLFGYVVIPEHIHLVLYPPDGLKPGTWPGSLKGQVSRQIHKNWGILIQLF